MNELFADPALCLLERFENFYVPFGAENSVHSRCMALKRILHDECSPCFPRKWINLVRKPEKVVCLQINLSDLSQICDLSEGGPKRGMHS